MYETIRLKAIELIERDGFINLSLAGLCEACGVKEGSFRLYTGYSFTGFVDLLKSQGVTDSGKHEAKRARANSELRKQHIFLTAVHVATVTGYRGLKRSDVAKRAGVSASLVSQYFTMSELRREIVRHAIEQEIPSIMAEAIVNKHVLTESLTDGQKRKALNAII